MKWHLNISYPAASAVAALKWSISLSLSLPFEASDWATSIEFFTSKIDAKTWPMAVVKRQKVKISMMSFTQNRKTVSSPSFSTKSTVEVGKKSAVKKLSDKSLGKLNN